MRREPGGRSGRARAAAWGGLALLLAAAALYMIPMPGRSHRGPLPLLSPEQAQLCDRIRRHVEALSGGIGERNFARPEALERAARYVEGELWALGREPESQPFVHRGRTVRNIEARLPGAPAAAGRREPGSLVVGAHYDSVLGSPGANDNATGVAAVLELARLLGDAAPAREVRFVFFVNEEPPTFQTAGMGSLVYARSVRERGEPIRGMLSIETIGCYRHEKGSQRYPFPFGLFYPGRGDFIGFVGNLASRALVRRSIAAFRRHAAFPSEGVAAPGWLPGIGWSDHWSFWQVGVPAVMVTDTAPFRYPHYHTPQDTPDRIDYEGTARVVSGLAAVVRELSGEG